MLLAIVIDEARCLLLSNELLVFWELIYKSYNGVIHRVGF